MREAGRRGPVGGGPRGGIPFQGVVGLGVAAAALVAGFLGYNACKIEVSTGQQAILIRKAGLDMTKEMELAAPFSRERGYTKGIQPGVLTEGRYFYNPFFWSWEIGPQAEIPAGKIGVRVALEGEELPPGKVLAEPGQKGIRRDVLRPGRYAINTYAERIEEFDQVAIPPGSRGVVTLLAGEEPKDSNVVLVARGERGVQKATLPPGTHYLNPYETRVSVVNCRSRRFNLGQDDEMSFLTSDGFVVVLEGSVEFRIQEDRVAEVFVLYNEDANGDAIDEEIVAKIITPESRSICRINGSKLSGRKFFDGEARQVFQNNLKRSLVDHCKQQGIQIVDVPISSIQPPQEIAEPVRARELAKQNLARYLSERDQQESEKQLKIEKMLADQGRSLVEAGRIAEVLVKKAEQEQNTAVTRSEQKLAVSKTRLEAARDEADAQVEKARAEAEVIVLKNKAELAGLASQVAAFNGDGAALAQNLLIAKLAPAFRSILSNSDGPLMELFGQLSRPIADPSKRPQVTAKTSSPATAKAELPRDAFSTPTSTPTPTPTPTPSPTPEALP